MKTLYNNDIESEFYKSELNKKEFMNKFVENLPLLRIKLGMTQEALAKKVEV